MTSYTLWSRDRLLGETDLGWVRCIPKVRCGFLHPSELGAELMPIACGVSPALRQLSHLTREMMSAMGEPAGGISEEALRATPQYADVLAAFAHAEGLELELRGPNGAVIPTEDISIVDGEYLMTLAAEAEKESEGLPDEEIDDEMLADLEELFGDRGEPWAASTGFEPDDGTPVDFPRYQIHVHLFDEMDVP